MGLVLMQRFSTQEMVRVSHEITPYIAPVRCLECSLQDGQRLLISTH